MRGSLEFELNHYIGKNQVEEIVPLTQESEETLTFNIELIEILDDNSVEIYEPPRRNTISGLPIPSHIVDKMKFQDALNQELKQQLLKVE